ncbi:MAG: citrate lyase acyl carrier protein [Liquorilactobacillus nagelii]|uniref:Citrate lyase acyl carrier protein n=1 Tax=Liquorilactobacillus nagelii TaxID=82688 RepID=A0A3Q8CBD2_9LACO|nr:citrate lyase acyl carrier protein [Liquorilactobacillus nagelii]AUJ31656.1 citrate lyase acyl carrier protein [Liquorilactobacillus nagelii]MCC7615980.1 citrate lyase acyl carrier protein [Liquorilactobacillus nagelii]MCP9314287.1 citrate lyase acyl carrier protein [Liquorilactobacillus nagelii]
MEIKKTALAGTLESSDIQILITKGTKGIEIELESDVKKQFGDQICQVISKTLADFGISQAKIKAVDKGALDCVIKARTIAAAQRAIENSQELDWKVI